MKINDCLIYYATYDIFILKLNPYINIIANKIFQKYADWNLIEKKINVKNKLFNFFASSEIDYLISSIKEIYNKENVKIFIVFTKNEIDQAKFDGWFTDYTFFEKKIFNILKKKTKYLKIIKNNLKFTNFITQKNKKYGIPTGEEIEFLQNLR